MDIYKMFHDTLQLVIDSILQNVKPLNDHTVRQKITLVRSWPDHKQQLAIISKYESISSDERVKSEKYRILLQCGDEIVNKLRETMIAKEIDKLTVNIDFSKLTPESFQDVVEEEDLTNFTWSLLGGKLCKELEYIIRSIQSEFAYEELITDGSECSKMRISNKKKKKMKRLNLREELEKKIPEECAICMENIADFAFIPCGHNVACTDCAKTWLKKHNTCPWCRGLVQIF